jgi:hypothetical protein
VTVDVLEHLNHLIERRERLLVRHARQDVLDLAGVVQRAAFVKIVR